MSKSTDMKKCQRIERAAVVANNALMHMRVTDPRAMKKHLAVTRLVSEYKANCGAEIVFSTFGLGSVPSRRRKRRRAGR